MLTSQETKTLGESINTATGKKFEWLKQILLMASGLIGILVSLHSEKSTNVYTKWSFCITISTLGLGILCGCIALFGEVSLLQKATVVYGEKLIRQITEKNISGPVFVKPDKIYLILEKICFILFFLSIISLITYAILLEMLQ